MRVVTMVLAATLAGCATTSGAVRGLPMTLSLEADHSNPDVVWVVMPIATPKKSKYTTNTVPEYQQFYGLFACYRSPVDTPAPPRCFLAQMDGDLEDLSWPGRVHVDTGVVVPVPVDEK